MNEPCEVCGSTQNRLLFQGRDWLQGQPAEFQVVQCVECGLVYLWPRPEDPLAAYPEDYAPHVGQENSSDIAYSAGHRSGLLRKARLACRQADGPLLDVGCASGEFLSTMQHLDGGRTLWGTDISARAAYRARHQRGINVWLGSVTGLPLPNESASVITLWHVLEHVPSPVAALGDLARILQPHGALVLACPMHDSWEARLFGRHWSGYDVPRHLFTFSRQTLPRMLDMAGFEYSEVLQVVRGYNSARLSAAFWLQTTAVAGMPVHLLRVLAALLGAGVALACELLSWFFGNRRAIGVFVARKKQHTEGG
ncbi:MAG: class I SAM-dependent methyltransferase [Anaerolineae bacterium]|nr:class I SAM-dependent methyltransferase [Anaerolineae bacterium]